MSNAGQNHGDILIVDDKADNLRLLSAMLLNQGYHVRKALNGQMALMAAQKVPPDLIFLDINMPGMDGYTCCRTLKQDAKTQDIPVIFISALNETFNKVKAFEVGGVDYVTKPLQEQEVLARMRNQLTIAGQRKALEQEIERRQAIEQELKMANENLEAFNYSVAHDLKNHLAAVYGTSDLLLTFYGEELNQEVKSFITRIFDASKNMDEVLKSLLLLSVGTYDCITDELVDLSALATQILHYFQQMEPERQVEVSIEPIEAYGMTQGNRGLLKVVLENLLGNAWKYTAKTENARIEFGVISDQNEAGSGENTSNLIYFVRDNGAGFDMAKAQDLFKPFKRLHHQEFKGTGIGLSTVQRIIDCHKGNIWYEAAVNQGATFFFQLFSAPPKNFPP
jgi:two-component system sensor histidine kinase/response regulator